MKDYNMMLFHELLSASQEELLLEKLPNKFNELGMKDNELIGDCLFVHGNVPVLLVCHADIVGSGNPDSFIYQTEKDGTTSLMACENRTLGGDDRCGQYIILEALKELVAHDIKPYVLVTSDEEKGCIGASSFVKAMPTNEYDIKFMIELDRRGANDLVYYDCDGYEEFMRYCEQSTSYVHNFGSYSDIVELMDAWHICGVNMSCGYYNEHTANEFVIIEEMMNTLYTLVNWLQNVNYDELERFEYEPKQYNKYGKLDLGVYGTYGEYTTEEIVSSDGYGSEYTVCADCGRLVSMQDSAFRYGIPLCEECQCYYDDIVGRDNGYSFADEPTGYDYEPLFPTDDDDELTSIKGMDWQEIMAMFDR